MKFVRTTKPPPPRKYFGSHIQVNSQLLRVYC